MLRDPNLLTRLAREVDRRPSETVPTEQREARRLLFDTLSEPEEFSFEPFIILDPTGRAQASPTLDFIEGSAEARC